MKNHFAQTSETKLTIWCANTRSRTQWMGNITGVPFSAFVSDLAGWRVVYGMQAIVAAVTIIGLDPTGAPFVLGPSFALRFAQRAT